MAANRAGELIKSAVLDWQNVTAQLHRFGGTEYRVGRREIGHVHGDYLVDIPFSTRIRDELVQAGRAEPHHIYPETGWVSFYLNDTADVDDAIALLRYSYELAIKQKSASKSPMSNAMNELGQGDLDGVS